MKTAVSRARVWALLGLLAYSPLAPTQTMELITGGARFVDVPGISVNTSPNTMVVGPDGALYLGDSGGRLVRLNLALGTATSLPDMPGKLNLAVGQAIAFDATGQLHAAFGGSLYTVDVVAGTASGVGALPSVDEMIFAADGTLYFANTYEHQVGMRLPSGEVVIIAGVGGESGYEGDGGPAVSARLAYPQGIVIAPDGDIYFADSGNSRVRRISLSSGVISTVAGTGEYGYNGDGLTALVTNFSQPTSLAFDTAGNLHVADWGAYRIRRIDTISGLVSTVAGDGQYGGSGDGGVATVARITFPRYLRFDTGGNLYFADSNNNIHNVRRIAAGTGIITRILGNDTNYFCGEGVPAAYACLAEARNLDVDGAGNLLVSDGANQRIRKISASTGLISTLGNVANGSPFGLEHDADGNIYVATWSPYRVDRINAVTGVRTPFAGNGSLNFGGDGGLATAAMVGTPTDVAVDAAGNVYITDTTYHRIRRIAAGTGIITTYAGGFFSCGWSGDGGPATAARLCAPSAIEFDPAGNLVISERQGCRLRRVNAATGIISTIAGNAGCTSSNPGDGGLATATSLGNSTAFAFDPSGNIYLGWSNKIRRIDAVTGIISSTPAPAAGLATVEGLTFSHPTSLEFDAAGRLYVTDQYRPYVFRISGLLDSTPPTIAPNIVGTAGAGGWYRSDVQITWSVSDAESNVSSSSGCAASSVSDDTTGITFTCTATSIGGAATQSVTIRRDTVAPSLTFGAASPAADAAGWNSTDVGVPFDATDALSGVYSASSANPLSITAEGAGVSAQVTVTDQAGNSATFTTPAFNIDKSPPVIGPNVSGTSGTNGWYTSDVQVSWVIDESPASIISVNGCGSSSVTADTAGVTFTCSVISGGGTASSSVTVKRDATPPVLNFGTPSPVPNVNGWNKTNVSITFTRADAMSGLAATSATSPLVLSAEGEGVTSQVVVADLAGNTATFTTVPRNIDKAAPYAEIQVPEDAATYGFYADVVAQYECVDISLVSCTGPNAIGELVNTKTAGSRSFKITAKDQSLFTTTHTHTFTVASTFNFDGFLAPANDPPIFNRVLPGSLVPVRWRLPDGHGGFVSNTASFTSATVATISCGSATAVPLNDTASGSPGISFDAGTNAFTYNWQTTAGWTGCRKLTIRLRDNSVHELRFRFQ